MKIILAGNMPPELIKAVEGQGFEVILSPCNPNVASGLSYHPDMQLASINGVFVCEKSLYNYYRSALGPNVKLEMGATELFCNYPGDIAYNIKVIQNKVFHNFKHTDPQIMVHAKGMELVDVSQGYSGCSICAVGRNAIITADKPIDCKAIEAGVDSLLIQPGYISLPGYDYGFVGGASFCANNTVYFFGNIKYHPDCKQIEDFCNRHNVAILSLAECPLVDYGSAITID